MGSLTRKKLQLQVEATALASEKGKDAKKRLTRVQAEIAGIEAELEPLLATYHKEKSRIDEIRRIKKKIQDVERKIAAADLKFYALPDLTARLQVLESPTSRKPSTPSASSSSSSSSHPMDTSSASSVSSTTSEA